MAQRAEHNPDRSTWGRRCELGCESWPDTLDYEVCARCGGTTERFSNLQPMSDVEARRARLHAEFEKFYEERCKRLGIPPTGPLPEWYELSLPVPAAQLAKLSWR